MKRVSEFVSEERKQKVILQWRMKMESDIASEEWKQKVILQVKNENRKWICEWRIESGLMNDESESGNWRRKILTNNESDILITDVNESDIERES